MKPLVIHGWLRTSVRVARVAGVVTSMRERRCLHSARRQGQLCRSCTASGPALTGAEPSRVLDLSSLDLCVKSGHALVVEGHLAAYEDVEDDTEAPDVDLGSSVGLGVE